MCFVNMHFLRKRQQVLLEQNVGLMHVKYPGRITRKHIFLNFNSKAICKFYTNE